MKYYFYSRISTVSQTAQRQLENFKSIPEWDGNNYYSDKIQGNIPFFERPEAVKMFDAITEEAEPVTLCLDSIDRAGRSLIDILATITKFNQLGINIRFLKESFSTLKPDGSVNPVASLLIGVMGSIAELERSRIKARTAEGVAIRKSAGGYKGRKVGSTQSVEKLLSRHSTVVAKLKRGLTIRDIVEITGKSSATVIKVKKVLVDRGELNGKGSQNSDL